MLLDRAIHELLLQLPFLGQVAVQLPERTDATAGDVALTFDGEGRAWLAVAPERWSRLPLEVQAGLLAHELWHYALAHPLLRRQAAAPLRFDLAADLTVQALVPEEWRAPHGLELPEALAAAVPEPVATAHDVWQWYHLLEEPAFAKWCAAVVASDSSPWHKHIRWECADRVALHHRNRVVERARAAAGEGEAASGRHLPKGVMEKVQPAPEERSGPDWRRVLALFVRRSSRTEIRETVKRPSKRYGRVPGIRVQPRQDVVVAIDTSGSVQADELAVFAREIRRLWRTGTDITVMECDYRVRRVWRYRGQPFDLVEGRGGTDFQPAIDRALALRAGGLVYFTDGFGAVPRHSGRLPVLWVISAGGLDEGQGIWHALPGKKIKLKPDA